MAKPRVSIVVACGVCNKEISRKADLPRHMKTHATNKEDLMYTCPYIGCTYKTLQRSNLATHKNVHSRERPHKCPADGCDFTSSDPGSLTRHRKDIHGYEPKVNSRSHPSATARKAARQRRKISPYTTSSSSSSSGRSASTSDSSADTYRSPRPQIPQVLDRCTSSPVLLTNNPTREGAKNNHAAYRTELITKLLVDDPTPTPNPQTGDSLPLASGLLIAPEAPAVEYPQLPVPDQGGLHATDLPAQRASEATPDEVSDADLDTFLSQLGVWRPNVTPAHTAPPLSMSTVQHHAGNAFVPTSLMLPLSAVHYAVDLPALSPIYPPYYEYTIDNTPHGYHAEGLSLDARPSQLCSFAAPNMGVHFQIDDQTYFYPAPAATNVHPMQEFYLY